jgi:hypothetical protein
VALIAVYGQHFHQQEKPMNIHLKLINRSNDLRAARIVIFQKNIASAFDELPVAWQVIEKLNRLDIHTVPFTTSMLVGAIDSYGNYTPLLDAQNGQLFQMAMTSSGDCLEPAGSATNPKEVQVLNTLPSGAINAIIYKNLKHLAIKTSIAPQQKAVFQFKPTIWIGIAPQTLEEGDFMNSAITSHIDTELSLLGVASADIVMTGGGPGAKPAPYEFSLYNVKMA